MNRGGTKGRLVKQMGSEYKLTTLYIPILLHVM